MELFLAVVEDGGFASAARRMKQPAPAVTRAVAELEARLGVRLLHRTTRVVRVTEAGARYAADCRRLLAEIRDAEEAASGVQAVIQGTLTVTAPMLLGAVHVNPIVLEYLRLYPGVDARCWFVDRVVNLIEEGVDVAVRVGDLPDSGLHAVRVGQVRQVLCASPDYLRHAGTPTTPQDLAHHTVIAAAMSVGSEWRFVKDGVGMRQPIQPRLTTTSNDAAVRAMLNGFGIARMLSYQVAEHVQQGRAVMVLRDVEPPPLPVHVVYSEGRHASQKVRGFLDLAVERLRADPVLQLP
jgi:DNA-binding transcriptional LysR family regulator